MKNNELLSWLAGVALMLSAVSMAAEETAVVKGARINVRGRPSLIGEVITQLQKGEKVVILEEITLSQANTNEPPKWLRIQMPANTPVWVYAPFVDPAGKTVNVSRLNLRGGPGENYSVVGRLERGAAVREIRRVEDWMEIETPPDAYGFIASDLVEKVGPQTAAAGAAPTLPPPAAPGIRPGTSQQPAPGAAMPAPSTAPTQASPTQQSALGQHPATAVVRQAPPPAIVPSPAVGEWQPVRPQSSSAPPTSSDVRSTPAGLAVPSPVPGQWQPSGQVPSSGQASPASSSSPTVVPETKPVQTELLERAPAPIPAKTEAAPPRRIVRREGLVRSTISLQAPTYFELLSPANRKTINYLHTEKLGLNLKDYRGRRIVVTGEEAIDPRWPRTPVIEVETLELVP